MKVLITGISRGIGAALAQYYLNQGYKVTGISRSSNPELQKHPNFNFISLDLKDIENLNEKLKLYLNNNINFELIILNSGILGKLGDMIETSQDTITEVMNVNVWANKKIIDFIVSNSKPAQIVGISSGAAISASRGWNVYAISKAALNTMIKLYSEEFPQIHFAALAPGIVDTFMQDIISSYPEDSRFPVIKKLKQLKGTGNMPTPNSAAITIAEAIEKIKNMPSGQYYDVREI
ncbi:MAG TPA: SDR family NAD(P)-dependent oxidoreductase [Bacteroidales bacterium]|nr:SDR family NAD(P)-dependent oxidoreductase [Bacteroidales bacterium]HOL98663.1 SDR family NAD(P)-dependent oxidoreductase [Bacteroidales bacterium]HOM35910.1 SDR family NAD(P)-dependent oxidoreductase [Bacteroidales bacterium]HPD24482.1 SDR family NAD(P)-dependent oxidoreductase [Bacteroidales bacterium]HRT00308.1 SDR family NAD(P)-dependent oxidoreductase [Bacteroidales bacterium]